MMPATIQKAAASAAATAEQLEKINAFSRRELTAEEVYVFSLVLCDNDVDRDCERFPQASLETLGTLFVGKTGIFDHNPKGENQTARIFDTALETDETRSTAAGEAYCALRAWAYMVRCAKNEDLILEIDAGIKKEVSVGCAVARTECSVCGANVREAPCAHEPGKTYGGALCWRELVEPTDAYEWSFVAVPAQKRAGVTKGRPAAEDVEKALERGGEVTLSAEQAAGLAARLRELDALAAGGRQHLVQLRHDLVRLAALALPEVDGDAVEKAAGLMEPWQLEAFCEGLSHHTPVLSQLWDCGESDAADNRNFLI